MDPTTEMSPKEMELVQEFRERVADVLPKLKSDFHRQDLGLLRFLRARELNLNKSEEMLRKHIEWRANNHVDEILDVEMPEQMFEEFRVKICGRDKEGYLVAGARIGHFDFRSLVDRGLEDTFHKYVIHWFERMMDYTSRISSKDRYYCQLCIIFEFESFEYRQLASKGVISMLIELVQMFEANYPEVLRVVYVINAPAVFSMLWNILKPFLTERTKSKVRIHGSNRIKWRDEILTTVDEDNIPSLFGGSNTSCLDVKPDYKFDIKTISPNFKIYPEEELKHVNVAARQLHTVEVNGSVGLKIHWNFKTEMNDIAFRIDYEDVEDIIAPCKVDSHLCLQKGTITCDKNGRYTLVFDNSYSSFTGKSLRYVVWTS